MYREEDLIVDIKVKQYNPLILKQMDTTKINFKLLDGGLVFDISELEPGIVFTKPNNTVVLQSSNIIKEGNTITVTLIEDCLRLSGHAKMEVELKQNTEVVSSFLIPIEIEPTGKGKVESTNTPNYIEALEEAIKQEKIRQEAEKERVTNENTRKSNEETREDAETTRITSEEARATAEATRITNENTRTNNEETRQNAETTRIANEEARVAAESQRVEEFEEIKQNSISVNTGDVAQLKKDVIINRNVIVTTAEIPQNTDYTIPIPYKVGNNSLEVYYMEDKLVKTTDDLEGHYKEVGEVGSISNKIQFDRWGQAVPINRTIEFIVRGNYNNDTNEGNE